VELYLHSPDTPSWHGAQLKHRDNFTSTLFWSLRSSVNIGAERLEIDPWQEWLWNSVQTCSGAHRGSYPMGTGDKASGAWSWPLASI